MIKYPLYVLPYVLLTVAVVSGVAIGLWQIYVIATIIYPAWGIPGLIVAYMFFPFTLIAVPVYSGLVLGNWSYLSWASPLMADVHARSPGQPSIEMARPLLVGTRSVVNPAGFVPLTPT